MNTSLPLPKLFLHREGGGIVRYHVFPSARQQTVAAHSWGVASILIAVLAETQLTVPLLKAALLHDVSEVATGDIPYHAKRREPTLRAAAKEITGRFEMLHGLRVNLSDFECRALAWADLAEAVIWLLEDALMGNRYAIWNLAQMPDVLSTKVTPPTPAALGVALKIEQMIRDLAAGRAPALPEDYPTPLGM